jgi:hypothetical protein
MQNTEVAMALKELSSVRLHLEAIINTQGGNNKNFHVKNHG